MMGRSDVARTGESDGLGTGSWALHGQSEGKTPAPSLENIIILVLLLIIMPVLAAAQKKAGTALGENLIPPGATATKTCVLRSLSALARPIIFALIGASWVDPVAGLITAAIALPEGQETREGRRRGNA